VLLVTNGSSVTDRLREDRFPATLLSWMDMLYEGPVVAGVDLPTLSEVRGFYLALEGYGLLDEISRDFRARDSAISRWREYPEVVLLFEHDLHDQLELVQILDFMARESGMAETRVTMSCINHFPGLDERFIGLGQLSAGQMRDVIDARKPVTPDQMVTARRIWSAVVHPTPQGLEQLLKEELSALPFAKAAIKRFLQELPFKHIGVSRTEWQILRVLQKGPRSRIDLFYRTQELEEAPFQGDMPVFRALRVLATATTPAVVRNADMFTITDFGRKILAGEADWTRIVPLNRWLGGTHLRPDGGNWRWDEPHQQVLRLQDGPMSPPRQMKI
jgi:hypothetical protein